MRYHTSITAYGIVTLDIDVESCVFASSPHHFINNNEEKSKQTNENLWNKYKHNDAASTVNSNLGAYKQNDENVKRFIFGHLT